MPDFKDMLKFFRMREGLSQSELAAKLGVSTSRISMYEAGKREPDFETEERIADYFNTDLNTLRGKDVEKTNGHSDIIKRFLTLFNSLNEIGQSKAIEYMGMLQKLYPCEEPLLNAAHERTDIEVTDEMRKHDEGIMDDDDF